MPLTAGRKKTPSTKQEPRAKSLRRPGLSFEQRWGATHVEIIIMVIVGVILYMTVTAILGRALVRRLRPKL